MLALVSASDLRPGELPWLRELPLVDADGEPAAADELLLPGSALAALVDPQVLGVVGADAVARWGTRVLTAVGVLADLTVVEVTDVVLDPGAVEDDGLLPGLAEWAAWAAARLGPADLPPSARTVRGIPELDVLEGADWAAVLARVAGSPALRSAVVDPVVVDLGGGRRALVPSHAAWWVRTHGMLAGRPPGEWAAPGAIGLDGLYDVLDAETPDIDPALLGAVGVRTSLADLVAESGGGDELLTRLGDGARTVPPGTMRAAYRALAGMPPESVEPPAMVRVGTDLVLPHDDVVVVDAPFHLQLGWARPPLVVPLGWAAGLAEVLDVARSSEQVDATLTGGEQRPVPDVVRDVLDGTAPASWQEHDDLTVAGREVTWWVAGDGAVHAATLDGLARGLAWAAGRWGDRLLVAAVLSEPGRVRELLAEAALQD